MGDTAVQAEGLWKVACDYPETELKKIVASDFAESESPAVDVVKNFKWTNDDQNEVAKAIAQDKVDPDDAADEWIDANQDKVDSWLP